MKMIGLVLELPSKQKAVALAIVAVWISMSGLALYGLGMTGLKAAQVGAVGLLCSVITITSSEKQRLRGSLICLIAGAVLWSGLQLVFGD